MYIYISAYTTVYTVAVLNEQLRWSKCIHSVQGLEGKGKLKHETCKSIAPLKLDPGETPVCDCVLQNFLSAYKMLGH